MITVAALYRFARFAEPAVLAGPLAAQAEAAGVKGTLLLATEGINGTIAGPAAGVAAMIASIRALPGCADLDVKYSHAEAMPFERLKVKVKPEIVTMGMAVDAAGGAGTHVAPQDWNALIDDPETLLIDTRNDYEVAIGSFAGAVDPGTARFRDFPAWMEAHLPALMQGKKRVAMFCTGGIRCEKATALAKAHGLAEVYHLKGGILNYLETMPESDSRWHGACFVFDERVALDHGLGVGNHRLCDTCGRPVSDDAQCGHNDRYG